MRAPTDENGLSERVIELVRRHVDCPPEKVTLGARLLEDLGVDGDDSGELLADFADTFRVDVSGYRWEHHFGTEGFDPVEALFRLIPRRWNRFLGMSRPTWMRARHVPITVGDLAEAAEARRWLAQYPDDHYGR